jgi:hypothetical protein
MWQKPDDGTFGSLQTRVVAEMKRQQVNDKVLAVMMDACEKALAAQKVVLSRPERALLFKKATTQLLNELLADQK